MSRLPFNPERMSGPPKRGRGEERPITVSQLAAMIDGALREGIPGRLGVVAEIGQCRTRTHMYFDLKDEHAVINCVMWASAMRGLGFAPETGMQVIAQGRVQFYPPQGRTQFYVESLEPVGRGELEARFRALCAELRELGWFDVERKRPLPAFPRRVAVVTSRSGAALQDVINTVQRRCPAVELALIDVRVQGEGAAPQVAAAMNSISRRHEELGIDAIIVTRGGGSLEDLWAFNERIVAEAIVRCAVPVVCAIGHETDTTIAELVADERCATPTQAAMRLVPDRSALLEQVATTGRRMAGALVRTVSHERQRIKGLARTGFFADPRTVIARGRDRRAGALRHLRAGARHRIGGERLRLERLATRLGRARPEVVLVGRRFRIEQAASALGGAVRHSMRRRADRLAALEKELSVAGPMSVMKRGFSVTTDAEGRMIRSSGEVAPGQRVVTRVQDGSFESIVEGGGGSAIGRKPRGAGEDPAQPDQMDLFKRSG